MYPQPSRGREHLRHTGPEDPAMSAARSAVDPSPPARGRSGPRVDAADAPEAPAAPRRGDLSDSGVSNLVCPPPRGAALPGALRPAPLGTRHSLSVSAWESDERSDNFVYAE